MARSAIKSGKNLQRQVNTGSATVKSDLVNTANIEVIKKIIREARKANDGPLEVLAEKRLREVVGGESEGLRQAFDQAMRSYEAFLTRKNGKKTRASRTWQAVQNYGVKAAIVALVNRKDDPFGLVAFVQECDVGETFEAIVARFPAEFHEGVVATARQRLKELRKQQF
jgi:hypothetical protein